MTTAPTKTSRLPQATRISWPSFVRILGASAIAVGVAAANTSSSVAYCQDETEDVPADHREEMPFHDDCLQHDHYDGVTLFLKDLDPALHRSHVFEKALQTALSTWKRQGRRGIWIHVPKTMTHLLPPCMEAGFDFHFCGNGHSLVLKRWLLQTPSRLPLGPTHQVGVGALVLKGNEMEMLVVQEKTGPAAALNLWKMPTGLLDPGEDVGDGAVRELKEETGLDATLERIVCFRQAHTQGRASDLFFICLMRLCDENQTPVLQEEEIADLKWMPFEEYANQEIWQGSPVYEELNAAVLRAVHNERAGMVADTLPVGIRPGSNTLYKSNM